MKKTIFYLFLAFTFLVIAVITLGYFQRDIIIEKVVDSLNQELKVKVEIKEISFSIIENFPKASIVMHHLYIKDKAQKNPHLAKIRKVSVSFNALEILEKKININELVIQDGSIHIVLNRKNEHNFDIFKDNEKDNQPNLLTTINNIHLLQLQFTYDDRIENTSYPLYINAADISFQKLIQNKEKTQMRLNGRWHLTPPAPQHLASIVNKPITTDLIISFAKDKNNFQIDKAQCMVGKYPIKLTGNLSFKKNLNTKISFELDKAVPGALVHQLIWGKKSKYYPFITKENVELYGKGEYVGNIVNNKLYSLKLTDIQLSSRNAQLRGNYTYQSTRWGQIELSINVLKANHIFLKNFPEYQSLTKYITLDKGDFRGSASVQGKLSSPQNKEKFYPNSVSANLTVQNFHIKTNHLNYSLDNLKGNLLFTNQKIRFENANFTYHKKLINGSMQIDGIKGWVTKNESPDISIQLSIPKLEREDILDSTANRPDEGQNNYSILPSKDILPFSIHLKIDELTWNRYRFKKARAKLNIRPQSIHFSDVVFDYAKGKVVMEGDLAKRSLNSNNVKFESGLSCKNVSLSELFYTSKNFGQRFIHNKHLEGSLSVASKIIFEIDLMNNVIDESINSTLDFTITDGQLVNFKPLQKLSKYLPKANFSRVNFGTLKNRILIRKNEIFIPKILVENSARTFEISGSHGFNQAINYQLRVPIKKTEHLSNHAHPIHTISGLSLYFNIIGTSDEYDIFLEKKKIKEEIKNVFKNEKMEWKERKELGGKKEEVQLKIDRKKKID